MSNDDKRCLATGEKGGNAEADPVSFLRRWSELKLENSGDGPAKHQERGAAVSGKEDPHDAKEREPGDADMPPLETLNEHSDYSGFFSSKVSEELRRLALRKLFHSPVFNVTDGLDDYAEDYTTFAKLGNIVTHDMRRMMDLEARRAKTPAGSGTAPSAETAVCDDNGADPSGDKIAREAAENTRQEAPTESRNDEDLDA
jgi:hypothetical protein